MSNYDALVIGAGAGGLFTAALLAHKGYNTLMVERADIYGGRAATRDRDGFAINTGALGIELGTETEQIFNQVKASLILREPSPGIVIRIGQKDLNISTGMNGWLARTGTHALRLALKAIPPLRPKTGETTTQWVSRFTRNETVHGVVHNFVGSIFAASPQQLPADLFVNYVTTKGAFKRYGFPPGGTGRVWDSLVEAFKRDGGELWLESTVTRLTFDESGRATGAAIERNGKPETVSAALVVSDIGPTATLPLCEDIDLPQSYIDQVQAAEPSAIITAYFASRRPMTDVSGFTCFSHTRRLCYATSFNNCPENAPDGWYIYNGASVPQPCTGDIDVENETALLLADLREQFPGFDQARLLEVVVTQGDWPAQRVIAGKDLPYTTPIANLWLVGDAVKQWGSAATTACAETALRVADDIAHKMPPSSLQRPTKTQANKE